MNEIDLDKIKNQIEFRQVNPSSNVDKGLGSPSFPTLTPAEILINTEDKNSNTILETKQSSDTPKLRLPLLPRLGIFNIIKTRKFWIWLLIFVIIIIFVILILPIYGKTLI